MVSAHIILRSPALHFPPRYRILHQHNPPRRSSPRRTPYRQTRDPPLPRSRHITRRNVPAVVANHAPARQPRDMRLPLPDLAAPAVARKTEHPHHPQHPLPPIRQRAPARPRSSIHPTPCTDALLAQDLQRDPRIPPHSLTAPRHQLLTRHQRHAPGHRHLAPPQRHNTLS